MTTVYHFRTGEGDTIGIYDNLLQVWVELKKFVGFCEIKDQFNKEVMTYELLEKTITKNDGIKLIADWMELYVDSYTLNKSLT